MDISNGQAVRQAWVPIGTTVDLVYTLAMGSLLKQRDIDLHIYTDISDIAECFKAVQKSCAEPGDPVNIRHIFPHSTGEFPVRYLQQICQGND